MVFHLENIVKTVRQSLDKAIFKKLIHVSLSGNKTTSPEVGGVKVVLTGIEFLSGDNIYVIIAGDSQAHSI